MIPPPDDWPQAKLVTSGIKTINEVRKDMDLPPVKYGDGWNVDPTYVPISPIILPEPSEVEEFFRKWREWNQKEILSILGIPAEYFKAEEKNMGIDWGGTPEAPLGIAQKEAGMNWRGLFLTTMLLMVGAFSAWQVVQLIWAQATLITWWVGPPPSGVAMGAFIILMTEIILGILMSMLMYGLAFMDDAPLKNLYGWVCESVQKKTAV